ncbi:MAG: hypothetical protein M3308_08380 [Actinomycetota bacterium]|nr:hypothetical protein [Actinomycetota bacterium]
MGRDVDLDLSRQYEYDAIEYQAKISRRVVYLTIAAFLVAVVQILIGALELMH